MAARILEAAQWLAITPQRQRPQPLVPYLQITFGLTAKESCDAIREANLIKARAH